MGYDGASRLVAAKEIHDTLLLRIELKMLIHSSDIENIGRRMNDLVEHHESPTVLLSLMGVENLSSSFINKIVVLNKRLQEEGRTLAVCTDSKKVMDVVHMVRLDKLLKFYGSEREAFIDL